MVDVSYGQDSTPLPEMALEFLELWFRGTGITDESLVSIVRIPPGAPRRLRSDTFTLGQIKGAVSSSGLDSLIWANDQLYDLYYTVGTLKEMPAKNKRGGLKNVDKVPGVWIDYDVKEGYFSAQDEILDFLDSLPTPASAVVLTGKGGVHAYWKLTHPVGKDECAELAQRWWGYQSACAEGREIDELCDPSRIMRLPGAVRWPKKPDQPIAPVALHRVTEAEYTPSSIRSITQKTWNEREERVRATRTSVAQSRMGANLYVEQARLQSGNHWEQMMALADVEDEFNETYSWPGLLEPLGWTYLGHDDDNRAMWSRPGDGVRKSATTDWPESPHVMSLFSTAPETGLAHLHESGVILTKYRVWVQLWWNGDEQSAVQALVLE